MQEYTNHRFLQVFADPVRSKIYAEIRLKQKLTVEDLKRVVTIKKSTIYHHLNFLVESGLVEVHSDNKQTKKGRPKKIYSLSQKKSLKMKLDRESLKTMSQEEGKSQITKYLRSLQLQVKIQAYTIDNLLNNLNNANGITSYRINNNDEITFKVNGKEYFLPPFLYMIRSASKIKRLQNHLYKKITSEHENILEDEENQSEYQFMISIFPNFS